MSGRRLASLILATTAIVTLAAAAEAASKRVKVPLPRARPSIHFPMTVFSPAPLALHPVSFEEPSIATAALARREPEELAPLTPTDRTPARDVELVKQAVALVGRDRFNEATSVERAISDPLARKLVEWMILRGDENHSAGFERYAIFVTENPSWPSVGLLRRRAEAALWDSKSDSTTILAYFANNTPQTAKGKFAYARALLARGDTAEAERQVRDAWRNDPFSSAVESMALIEFKGLLRPSDDYVRMHRRLYAEDTEAGLSAAYRLDATARAIARAWVAVNRNASNAAALLGDVAAEGRSDPGYIFSRARFLRRHDKIAEAGQLLINSRLDPAGVGDGNAWWVERRLIARKLLDIGEPRVAYRVARDAPTPAKDNYRVDRDFTAGWIALRFLHDPATAMRHFAGIPSYTTNPTALARAGYWQGRTAEALGRPGDAKTFYLAAGRFSTTYYGQLARARLGESEIALRSPPIPSAARRAALARSEIVRALELVYAAGARDLAIPIVADVAHRTDNVGQLLLMGEIARQNRDARAMLMIGRAALGHGYAFAQYAFPTIGVPAYRPIGPQIDASLLYSIVRQESAFNPKTVSSASAYGLMQVTPEAGRYIAHKFGVRYDRKRLLDDSVYNVQMGAAELGDLIHDYRGSYILTFVGYNAGRGRVRDWIARYGDPRNPNVDPVDWVEMIPFSETRNYVQRILENMQVYRARFGKGRQLMIEADLHRGAEAN